jgi:uncharacterized protein YecA (UPF0149 family)
MQAAGATSFTGPGLDSPRPASPTQQQAAQPKQEAAKASAPSTGDDGEAKVGRNEPCPCGSGKKFKKCCGQPGGGD